MPLKKGKKNIGANVKTEEAAGKSKKQAVAIALHEADMPKKKMPKKASKKTKKKS